MKPIGKYIVIKEIKEELKTESGLLLSAHTTIAPLCHHTYASYA